jgi:disulfide bond formation protein DsbB
LNDLQRRGIGAAAGSAALLLAALAFQYVGGLAPCPLCITQRWPHVVAILLGVVLVFLPSRGFALLGALAMALGSATGVYHAGIERGWWPGPDTCTAPDTGALSSDQLLDRILETDVVLCDQIAWSFLGISMAGWNAIASAILVVLWLRAYASSSASQ